MGGGPGTPELAAAVSNAGGLGSLGVAYMTPDEIRDTIRRTRALEADRAWSEECVEACTDRFNTRFIAY